LPAARLLLDADVDPTLAEILSSRGYDAVSALRIGELVEAPDEEILDWAIRHGRAILTHNIKDFVPLARVYAQRGWEHHGIILSEQQIEFRELLSRTLHLLSQKNADDLLNAVEWLQNYR
jgi:predicted nuclease of predicted toxin-antitoxin system